MQPCHVKNVHEHCILYMLLGIINITPTTKKPQADLPEMHSQVFQHK